MCKRWERQQAQGKGCFCAAHSFCLLTSSRWNPRTDLKLFIHLQLACGIEWRKCKSIYKLAFCFLGDIQHLTSPCSSLTCRSKAWLAPANGTFVHAVTRELAGQPVLSASSSAQSTGKLCGRISWSYLFFLMGPIMQFFNSCLLPPCIWWLPPLHAATSFLPSFVFIIKISLAAPLVLPHNTTFPTSSFLQLSSWFNSHMDWAALQCTQPPPRRAPFVAMFPVLVSAPPPQVRSCSPAPFRVYDFYPSKVDNSPFAFSFSARITSWLFHLLLHSGSAHTPALNVQLCRSMCWACKWRAAAKGSSGNMGVSWGDQEGNLVV